MGDTESGSGEVVATGMVDGTEAVNGAEAGSMKAVEARAAAGAGEMNVDGSGPSPVSAGCVCGSRRGTGSARGGAAEDWNCEKLWYSSS